MLDAGWALDKLSLVAEYRRHLNEGAAAAPASGELLRLVQLLQCRATDRGSKRHSAHDSALTGHCPFSVFCIFVESVWTSREGATTDDTLLA